MNEENGCPYCKHRKAWVWNKDGTILIPWKCNYCLNKIGDRSMPCFEPKSPSVDDSWCDYCGERVPTSKTEPVLRMSWMENGWHIYTDFACFECAQSLQIGTEAGTGIKIIEVPIDAQLYSKEHQE
jgi:hypothetical protein